MFARSLMVNKRRMFLSSLFVEVVFLLILASVLHVRRTTNVPHRTSSLRKDHSTATSKRSQQAITRKWQLRAANSTSPIRTSIAIGLAITSKRLQISGRHHLAEKMPFFRSLLRSFCRTASVPFDYQFYVAYDYDDAYFGAERTILLLRARFERATGTLCPRRSTYSLFVVRCRHSGRPARAQNDAMMAAYLNGADYFYRVNDDTVMTTGRWTERFVAALDAFRPPKLGVVGPSQLGGNRRILTYEFTHRTHVDVHGFYYPRLFTDWYADRWMSEVYQPDRYAKLRHIRVLHTNEAGTRYSVATKQEKEINQRIAKDMAVVKRYAAATAKRNQSRDQRKVIALTLDFQNSNNTWNVLRNAQLMSVMFPEWTLRLYTDVDFEQRDVNFRRSFDLEELIGDRRKVYAALTALGAGITIVEANVSRAIPSNAWHYLLADDRRVEIFLLRESGAIFTDRDARFAQEALRSGSSVFSASNASSKCLSHDAWGAWSRKLRLLLGAASMEEALLRFYDRRSKLENRQKSRDEFLRTEIFDKLENDVFCYSSGS